MIKIGFCLPRVALPEGMEDTAVNRLLEANKAVFDAGFDYVECTVASLIKLSEEEYTELRDRGFRAEACNSFLPASLPVCGFGEEMERYVEKALARAAGIGCKIVVFGSEKARNLSENTSFEEGMEEIKRFLRMCEPIAAKNDITLVIEPLNPKACNIINYVSEGDALVRELSLPHIANLADSFHMYQGNEPLENLAKCHETIKHVHIAEGDTRAYPGAGDGVFLGAFAELLKGNGYDGRVSAECRYPDADFSDVGKPSAEYMRKLFS